VADFEVKLRDGTTELIEAADAYRPDGQLTCIRTTEIVAVRRRAGRGEERAA